MADRKFDSVFSGLDLLIDELKKQAELFATLNQDLKIEVNKSKKFNKKMAVLALISLGIGVLSFVFSVFLFFA